MAIPDTNANEVEKSSLKEIHKTKDKKERPLTKVVIRRLPPNIDQESFLAQISPVPDYDYIYTVKGEMTLGENAFARVYISFTDPGDIYLFKEKFDNYVFLDHRGHEYPAVVEFASFQKIPKKRRSRPDPKCGTVESDPFYLEFLESLNKPPNQDEKPEYSYQFSLETKESVVTTPLLEYVKQRRIDKQRIREERREERRRRELERKRIKDEERKKHYEEKSSSKSYPRSYVSSRSPKKLDIVQEEHVEKKDVTSKDSEEKVADNTDNVEEKVKSSVPAYADKERKYEDHKSFSKIKPRFPKFDSGDKKTDYKSKKDDYKDRDYRYKRYDDYKREPDPKQYTKKVKKYSERREERKNEAKKVEQQKFDVKVDKNKESEVTADKSEICKSSTKDNNENVPPLPKPGNSSNEIKGVRSENKAVADHPKDTHHKYNRERCKDDPRLQRRIKNKDRPTMALYQPGMLSKRKQPDGPETEYQKSSEEKE